MSRHLRRIERTSTVRDRRPRTDAPARLDELAVAGFRSVPRVGGVLPASISQLFQNPDPAATVTNLDADHAAAAEREAIAKFCDWLAEDKESEGGISHRLLARAIRVGMHQRFHSTNEPRTSSI